MNVSSDNLEEVQAGSSSQNVKLEFAEQQSLLEMLRMELSRALKPFATAEDLQNLQTELASRLDSLEKRAAKAASKDDVQELTNRLDTLEGQNKQLKRELDDNQFFPSSRSIRPITSSDNKVRVGSSHADFNGFSSGPYTRPLAEAPRGYVEVLSDLTIAG